MADAPPQPKDLFDDPSAFGLTPARPADAAKPAADQPSPDFDPAKFQVTPTPVPQGIDPLTRRPFQYVGNVPATDPVGQSTGKPIQEDRAPGIGVQAAGSMATDPEQKRRIIAQQLFPDLGPQAAQSRVFYGPNGRMAAVGMDGRPSYVDPDRPDFSALRTFSPANLASNLGTLAGPALPAVGGVGAGAAAGPTSLIVGPLAAAAGAATGDLVRQTVAGKLDPGAPPAPGAPPVPVPYNYRQTTGEAVGAGIGQLAGASLLRLAAPNRLGLNAVDVRNIRADPSIMTNTNRVFDQAQAQGVMLTPGQASGLPSLLSHEDVIASGSAGPGTADAAATFYRQQRNQLNQAYQDYLGTVSSATDKTDAAMQFQQGAEDAQRIVRQQANAAARPSYQTAQAGGNVMSPDLAQLADTPAVRSALDAARTEYANLYRRPAPDSPDFALWDLTKRKLDDAVTSARRAGENTSAMAIDNVRSDLLTHLDAAYPTYPTARDIAAPGQRLSARLEGSLGKPGAGDETARAIVAPVFNTNNPRAISEARDAFMAAGRGDEWNAGIRAHLQDAFDSAMKSQDGLNPAMLRRQVWSDPNRQAAMQAAMSPQQFQGLNNIMETIEAAARSKGMNSLTTPRQAGAAALEEAASATPGVRLANLAGVATSPGRLMQGLGPVMDKVAGGLTRRNMSNIAGRLFSPDGVAFLNQAGMMAPGSQKLVSAVAEFIGQQYGGTAPAGIPPTPGLYLPGPRNQMAPGP